jgi:hypothetical protein
MTEIVKRRGRWKPGQSGNPKGRPAKGRALTEMLRLKGDDLVTIGGEQLTGQEALAKAVWEFVLTGEVWLAGKRLEARGVMDWAYVVKWLYNHVEPVALIDTDVEPEVVVRVVREEVNELSPPPAPLPQALPTVAQSIREGEESEEI